MDTPAYIAGARYAVSVKTAARVGATVPTGYRFNLNDDWVHALSPEAQAHASAEAQAINEWLAANGGAGRGFATNPEFSRRMALLGRLGRQAAPVGEPKMAADIKAPPPVKITKPPKLESPSTSNVPVMRPALLPGSTVKFDTKLTKQAFAGDDKLPGGVADKTPESAFDKKKLNEGAKFETEHTSSKAVAKEIASDHLKEDPNYYGKLKKFHIE